MSSLDVWVPPATPLIESARHSRAKATVAVTLFNYAEVVLQALDSVRAQTLSDLDLVVVDDCSGDGGPETVRRWMAARQDRFGRCTLLRHERNQGLAAARNQAFMASHTPFVFVLDADNELYPRCLAACLDAATASHADAVYTLLEVFGGDTGVMGTDLWDPQTLQSGNYLDAMALVARSAWQSVGGYRRMPANGWEDFDLWLKFAEAGFKVVRVPEILCRYRKHAASMLRSETNRSGTIGALHEDIELYHPAARLPLPNSD